MCVLFSRINLFSLHWNETIWFRWSPEEESILVEGMKRFGHRNDKYRAILSHYPSLNRTNQQLKDKWFLDVSQEGHFPPQTRQPNALVSPHTDGNLLEPLLNSAAMMAEFYKQVRAMIDSNDPAQHQVWVGSWRIQPVK